MLTVENRGLFLQGTEVITLPNRCCDEGDLGRLLLSNVRFSKNSTFFERRVVVGAIAFGVDFSREGDAAASSVVLEVCSALGRTPPASSIRRRFLSLPSSFRFRRRSSTSTGDMMMVEYVSFQKSRWYDLYVSLVASKTGARTKINGWLRSCRRSSQDLLVSIHSGLTAKLPVSAVYKDVEQSYRMLNN